MTYFLERILRATEFEGTDGIWWRIFKEEDNRLAVFALCNDFFVWACADVEEITPENLVVLEGAKVDLAKLGDDEEMYVALLFCSRVRGMRPQGAFYEHLPKPSWPLFDACGPERDPSEPGNTPKP